MTRYTPLWLQAGSYAASVDRRLVGALWPAAASSGCAVSAGSAMVLNVAAGQVAVPSQNSTGSTLCSSDAVEQVTITAAPPSGTNRIDLVTCHPRGNDLDGGSNTDFIFDVIAGSPATTPAPPALPAGQVALAQVYVGGGVASIVAANITDLRPGNLSIGALPASTPRGFISRVFAPAAQTDAGASFTAIGTITVPVTAGRWYRCTTYYIGTQQTAAANWIQAQLINNQNADASLAYTNSPAVGGSLRQNLVLVTQAATTANMVFTLSAATQAGTVRSAANGCWLAVEDIGTG